MLDSPKAQAVYRALQSSPGLSSTAGEKAAMALSKSTSIYGQLGELTKLPGDGLPPGGNLPSIVPSEIRSAAAKLSEYKAMMGGATTASEGLNNAIGQRMENAAGNMAMMNAACSVAQKMGEVPDGCGPLGAAFSVLTSEGRTDLLNTLMASLDGPLSDLEAIFKEALGLNSSSLPGPLKAALDAAMAACDTVMQQIDKAAEAIKEFVGEAQAMWDKLNKVFSDAVQSSILMSVINNPCLMAVSDAICPPEVSDVLNNFE